MNNKAIMLEPGFIYDQETRTYMLHALHGVNDISVWSAFLKYASIIRHNENRNVLINAFVESEKAPDRVFFSIKDIDSEIQSLLEELSISGIDKKFSIVRYKNDVFMITDSGDMFSGNEILDVFVYKRSIQEIKLFKGLGLPDFFLSGMVKFAVSESLFLRPWKEILRGERVTTSDQNTYLILDKGSLLTKIGRSADLYRRMFEFLNSNNSLVFVASCQGGHHETSLHKKYANKRKSREWFALTVEDIENIIEEYKMAVSAKKWKMFFK